MDKPNTTTDYLLLFRGTNWHKSLSPDQIQTTMTAWTSWFNGLIEEGKCKGGHPLAAEGRVVSGHGAAMSDGPFVETKEAIGGYFYLQVESEEEAVAIARRCPALTHGVKVEVRPVVPMCPVLNFIHDVELQQAQEAAHATVGA
jgi:hypothetical protein